MSRADDLTPLLAGPPDAGVGYRQGTIIAFDPVTLENTVRVAGTDLVDLPLLGLAEATTLRPGSVVGLLTSGSSWAIIGQLVIPGSAEAAAAISVTSANAYSVSTAAFESTASSTWTDLATVGPVVSEVRIGPSGRCLVWITCAMNPLVTAGHCAMAYAITGATTVPTGDTPPDLSLDGAVGTSMSASRLVLQEGLNSGMHTFTAKYIATDFGGGGSARFGARNLTVMAL